MAGASDITTIKVTKTLRDRITAGAAAQQQTVQRFIESVLENYERSRRLAAVAEAMANADEEVLRQWRKETDSWAAVDTDNVDTDNEVAT
jgi:ribosome-associated translation inhibitor RaiA